MVNRSANGKLAVDSMVLRFLLGGEGGGGGRAEIF